MTTTAREACVPAPPGRFDRRAVLAVFPLQLEELLVLVPAQLLEAGSAPALHQPALELVDRRRLAGLEEEPQREQLSAGLRIVPGELHAREPVGVAREQAVRVARGRRQERRARAQVRQLGEPGEGLVEVEAAEAVRALHGRGERRSAVRLLELRRRHRPARRRRDRRGRSEEHARECEEGRHEEGEGGDAALP